MSRRTNTLPALLLGLPLIVLSAGCSDGSDGAPGPPGPNVINASTAAPETLAGLDVVCQIESVSIASPPVVRFSMFTDKGVPIIGLVPFWEDSNRFVRFTITKLVEGQVFATTGSSDPDSWVAYVRDNGEPDYDTGASLVDNNDGTYTFTFNTDVTNVAGVPYEPTLTHRVAGQIGQYSTVPLEEQNVWFDFVPAGGAVTRQRNIAVMESCNDCHDNLVFHGRRFEVEYCVQCHNPDLANGEGNFAFMIHRVHSFEEFGGTFSALGSRGGTRPAADFSEVTYPQDLRNCRKCHNGDDADTPQADNWRNLPNIAACDGCHDNFDSTNNFQNVTHGGPKNLRDSELCLQCHGPGEDYDLEVAHTTTNFTPNNPGLLAGQRNITYELVDVSVDGSNNVVVEFKILDNSTAPATALDLTNLPVDLTDGMGTGLRYPTLLLAWAMPQDGIEEPGDYNNLILDPTMRQRGAQPISVNLDGAFPGTLSFNSADGVTTATITDPASQFPVGAKMRAVAMQNYLQQDLGMPTGIVSLHTPSVVMAVANDSVRRAVVDTNGCSRCHEWFEGHGGNRVLGFGSDVVCTFCHNPNQSSSGRTVTDPAARGLNTAMAAAITAGTLDPSVDPNDPLTYPEDAQNFKDLVHSIHSEGFRDRPFQHVRGPGRQGYYDWEEVTFPRGAETSNCELCHMDESYELPLAADLLPTTVRTTKVENGMDGDAEAAFAEVPNDTDWVNSPTAAACLGCHTSTSALAHMSVNGGFVSDPRIGGDTHTNRFDLVPNFESCAVCHGPGRSADLEVVHDD